MRPLSFGLALGALLATPIPARAATNPVAMKTNVLFIYDYSNSMWAKTDGTPKYEMARSTLEGVIKGLPADAKIGLLVFGSKSKNDCNDIRVLSPIGMNTAGQITKAIDAMQPLGITPLAASLEEGAELLKNTEGAKMLVLISDGGEECGGDPCAIARKLALSGMVIRVNTVGVLPTEAARQQLQCIAKEGAGRFFEVKEKQSLYQTVSDIKKDIQDYNPAKAPPTPTPAAEKTNLLSTAQGAKLAMSGYGRWNALLSGDSDSVWSYTGQGAVFSFKNDQPQRFSSFELAVPEAAAYNVKEFELQISDYAQGPYQSIGRFTVQNEKQARLYQRFGFSQVRARYLKFVIVSNYGAEMQGYGNTQVFSMRLYDDPQP